MTSTVGEPVVFAGAAQSGRFGLATRRAQHRRARDRRTHRTARLTIDVTPTLRGRIKVAAPSARVTAADMLPDLPAREFHDITREPS